MRASLIIPTKCKLDYLKYTLKSIEIQTNCDFETIIVNDSEDTISNNILTKISNLKLVQNKGKGISFARNTGIKNASGDIIIFSDDDRILNPYFVDAHVNGHEKNPSKKAILYGEKFNCLTIWKKGIPPYGGLNEYVDYFNLDPNTFRQIFNRKTYSLISPDQIYDFQNFLNNLIFKESEDSFGEIHSHFTDINTFSFPWIVATGGNVSYKRVLIDEIGSFDEGFVGWGVEDIDLAYRAYIKNATFQKTPHAESYHQVHPIGLYRDFRDANLQAISLVKNILYFVNKHKTLESYLYSRWFEYNFDWIQRHNLFILSQTNPKIKTELFKLYKNYAIKELNRIKKLLEPALM